MEMEDCHTALWRGVDDIQQETGWKNAFFVS
jgi:hypothetical protein